MGYCVSLAGSMMFLDFDGLRDIFEVLKKGREYLIEKDAGVDAKISQ